MYLTMFDIEYREPTANPIKLIYNWRLHKIRK